MTIIHCTFVLDLMAGQIAENDSKASPVWFAWVDERAVDDPSV